MVHDLEGMGDTTAYISTSVILNLLVYCINYGLNRKQSSNLKLIFHLTHIIASMLPFLELNVSHRTHSQSSFRLVFT